MRFMVSFSTRPGSEEAVVALVPAEQARIRALSEQGIVEALYLATDRAQGWLVMKSESLAQVQDYLRTLPLHAYLEMKVIEIH